MSSTILLPRILQVGRDASQAVGDVVKTLGCRSPLIITDSVMVELGYVQNLQSSLEQAGIHSAVFDQTVPEPTEKSILAGVEMAGQGDFDCLIALGGGSPIDSAKAIGILARFGGKMADYKFPRNVAEAGLPLIAIPTTAGTGSEMTRFTIITDDATDEKMLCVGLGFLPQAALAGAAFSAASVALVHGMSRPIGAHFHVPHGMSNAMLLPSVTEFSIPSARPRYAQCARAMGIATEDENDEVATDKLIAELKSLNEQCQVPTPAQFGIDKKSYFEKLELMAEQAAASGSPANNPRVPSNEEMVSLYSKLWVD